MKIIRFSYPLISILHLFAIATDLDLMVRITKPLLMIALLIWFLTETRYIKHTLRLKVILALILSWFGDIFLMLDESFFLPGLASFLLAHISFITVNVSPGGVDSKKSGSINVLVWVAALAYGAAMLWTLWPGLSELKLPVTLYTGVILGMLLTAFRRNVYYTSWIYVLTGALLFVVSDSILAYTLFIAEFIPGRVLVMSTYILGQYFLVRGYVVQMRQLKMY